MTYCLFNLSSDIGSLDLFKNLTKRSIFMLKTVENVGIPITLSILNA